MIIYEIIKDSAWIEELVTDNREPQGKDDWASTIFLEGKIEGSLCKGRSKEINRNYLDEIYQGLKVRAPYRVGCMWLAITSLTQG